MMVLLVLLLIQMFVTSAPAMSVMVTGDVNLNPNLVNTFNKSYVWGGMLPVLRSVDLLAINHESTLANVEVYHGRD